MVREMRKFLTLCMLAVLLFVVACGQRSPRAPEQPIQIQPTAEEIPPVEEAPIEQPAPAPVQEVPKPAPTQTAAKNTTTTKKEVPPIQQLSEAKKRLQEQEQEGYKIYPATYQGKVVTVEGRNYDEGTVRMNSGKQYDFVGFKGLKVGDSVEFQLDNKYMAANLKKMEEEREQYRLSQQY